MFDIANATDEQTDRWEQDYYTETKWKRLIETRNLEAYAFDANRYPAGASDAERHELAAQLETLKAELEAAKLLEAVMDKGRFFFRVAAWPHDWQRYLTITEELDLLPWLKYCVLDIA